MAPDCPSCSTKGSSVSGGRNTSMLNSLEYLASFVQYLKNVRNIFFVLAVNPDSVRGLKKNLVAYVFPDYYLYVPNFINIR